MTFPQNSPSIDQLINLPAGEIAQLPVELLAALQREIDAAAKQMKAVTPILVPLFVSSFNRADELANAMEARGYQGGEGRTKYRILDWQKRDTLSMLAFVALTGLLLFFRS